MEISNRVCEAEMFFAPTTTSEVNSFVTFICFTSVCGQREGEFVRTLVTIHVFLINEARFPPTVHDHSLVPGAAQLVVAVRYNFQVIVTLLDGNFDVVH